MAFPSPNDVSKDVTSPAPLPPSTNNNTSLSHSLKRLSISTASSTALPSSPRTSSPSRNGYKSGPTASPSGRVPPPSPLRRSSSSLSLDARASTPTLLRKASMNSLHGITPSRQSPSRRTSTAHITPPTPGKSPLSGIEDMEPSLPRHTAESIASKHFEDELQLHNSEGDTRHADTVVILHDSCYGHRYSRPRTSKAALSTIVERPERIQACVLGLSAAYVRLGERHSEGQYPLHPSQNAASIPSLPFQIRKTTRRLSLSSQAVTNVHGVKWMEELKIMCDNAEARLAMNGKELTRPDMTRSPDQGAPAKLHEGDLYLCAESLNAMEGALGAVCEGVDTIFKGSTDGKGPHRAFVTIRPPGHHCSSSYPSGFCWLNNVHVGISHAALTHGLTHAAIIDFDLHHGDGSQAMTWEHNQRANNLPKNALPWKKTSIGYFSLHDINSYPCEMGDEEKVKNASLCIENAHGQSIWNVHLLPWKSESEFWELYETKYSILLEKTRNYLRAQTERLRQIPNGPRPKAAIFLSAGFDASEWESSGMQRHKVNVPTEFYARLTRDVVRLAAEEGTGVEGRVISVLEGGYSDRALCSGVFSHLSGMVSGSPLIIKKEVDHSGLGYEMGQKIGAFSGYEKPAEPTTAEVQTYDPSWWSVQQLEQLEITVNPPPIIEPKKPREGPAPTYSSPTQSFIAKVTSPSVRRSASTMSASGSPRPVQSRAPSPPPPEVPWTVAAHELSKLLIPSDRQTMSCKPEDLSAEATRARRDRQSILILPITEKPAEIPNQRMALRTRKPVKAVAAFVEDDESRKPAAKTNRRKTVAGAAILTADKTLSRSTTPLPEMHFTKPTAQSARRLSLASNSGSVTSESARPLDHQRIPSNGSIPVQPRPTPSQISRPDSSMSSRGHSIPPVVVKKTRVPSQTRVEPAKTSRVRKKSPLNEAGGVRSVTNTTSTIPTIPSPPLPSQESDMDNLTNGMKQIKLNLVTKAQREAKEQAERASKVASSKASKPVVNRKVKTPVEPGKRAAQTPPASDGSSTQGLGSQSQYQAGTYPPMAPQSRIEVTKPNSPPHDKGMNAMFPLPPVPTFGQPFTPQPPPTAPASSTSDNTDIFIPYQPEGPTPEVSVQHEPLKWLPPNTSTPTPMKKGDLPVFTSTSAIPFGLHSRPQPARDDTDMQDVKMNQPRQDYDIWEVPPTPQK